ncbi:MAG: hypothetical protein J6U91_02965 [Alistipes sp.]|nr:hypothetical protein [Alistipes sp.]
MRRLLTFLSFVTLLVSCVDGEEQRPGFGVRPTVVELSALGGYAEVEYTLQETNGINPVALAEVEWIVDIDNSRQGVIGFRVLPNDTSSSREAAITLRHISTDKTPQFVVKQAGCDGSYLSVEITKLDYSECEVSIVPKSDELLYVARMAELDYLTQLGITTVEELVAADYNSFITSLTGDVSLEEYLKTSRLISSGSTQRVWRDLSPAKRYVVYVYGLYLHGDRYECITDVEYVLVDKRLPERADVEFDAQIVAEGPEVSFAVEPKGWDGYYMVQLVEDNEAGYIEQGQPFTSEAEEQVAEAFFYIADHLYYFEEKSAEEIMSQLGYSGSVEFQKTLNANHRYMALIYAIDSANGNVPMVVSKPQVSYFSTGDVERSDMTFEVVFDNIRPRSVDVTITPSSDESYTAVLIYAKNLPQGDKQQQLDYVMSRYEPLELSGIYREHISQLPPATEFVLAVYGFYADAATTDLFLYRFATLEDGEGTNRITSVSCEAYDLAEVVQLEPYYNAFLGYADYFISIEVATAEASPALHFDIFRSDVLTEYSEAEIRESLLDYSYTSSPDWALCTYGNEYVVCGLAEDENGYVGELFISDPITFNREDVSDAQEFVELYKDYVN